MQAFRNKSLVFAVLAALAATGMASQQSRAAPAAAAQPEGTRTDGTQATPTPAQRKEMEAARAELDRAARRYAELARKYHATAAAHGAEALRGPVLGVLLAPDDQAGVRIAGVTPESAAAEAGLRSGDRLLRIDGKQILGSEGGLRLRNARSLLRGVQAGKAVPLEYERDGRRATVQVAPRLGSRAWVFTGDRLAADDFGFDPAMIPDIDHEAIRRQVDEAVRNVSKEMPRIERELRHLGDCGKTGKDGEPAPCHFPVLAEAFRWSGLDLATVDPRLGRYFGTERGVLVLGTGEELAGLQPGDVVQRIDGKPVDTPREAMAALRAKPVGSSVRLDYLRDRKPGHVQVKVPDARFRIPSPPTPPAPPKPPRAPASPPSPPAPAPADAPAPPAPPAAPAGARTVAVGERRLVFVDDDGRLTVLEGEQVPAPPAFPSPPALTAASPPGG